MPQAPRSRSPRPPIPAGTSCSRARWPTGSRSGSSPARSRRVPGSGGEARRARRGQPVARAGGAAAARDRGARRARAAERRVCRPGRDATTSRALRVPDAARAGRHRARGRRRSSPATSPRSTRSAGRMERAVAGDDGRAFLAENIAYFRLLALALPERHDARARRADVERAARYWSIFARAAALQRRLARAAPALHEAVRRRDPAAAEAADYAILERALGEIVETFERHTVEHYVVVGAGAIGGTVGARLVRAGHSVLLCDADADARRGDQRERAPHRGAGRAVHRRGAGRHAGAIAGPARRGAARGQGQHTAAALEAIAPRLAPDGFVVSLQNGVNEPLIASIVGERADGRRVRELRRRLPRARADLPRRPRRAVRRRARRHAVPRGSNGCSPTCRDAKETGNILGFLWAKEAYGAMLFATAVSDLSIADALGGAALPDRLHAARARGARRRAGAGRAVRRLRRRRPRRLDRAARRVQPPLREDALGHLPRPDGAQAPDREGDARRPRRAARCAARSS